MENNEQQNPPHDPVQVRDINNYFSLGSKMRTLVSRFVRYENQLLIEFKTWLSKKHFEMSINDNLETSPPFAPLSFSFPIAGTLYDSIMSETGNIQLFTALDRRVKEIGQIASFGGHLDNFSLDCEEKVILINPKTTGEIITPTMIFAEPKFTSIVQNAQTAPLVAATVGFCLKYGAILDSVEHGGTGYIASLLQSEE